MALEKARERTRLLAGPRRPGLIFSSVQWSRWPGLGEGENRTETLTQGSNRLGALGKSVRQPKIGGGVEAVI